MIMLIVYFDYEFNSLITTNVSEHMFAGSEYSILRVLYVSYFDVELITPNSLPMCRNSCLLARNTVEFQASSFQASCP